jgi:predicted nucleic acid-binding Zn ribbon protein
VREGMQKKRQDARHVKSIIENLLGQWEKRAVKRGDAVGKAWKDATTEETREHARPVSFKNGILMVIVENSSWLYKLTLEKRKMLEKFNEIYAGRKKAQDIRFRVGSMED